MMVTAPQNVTVIG